MLEGEFSYRSRAMKAQAASMLLLETGSRWFRTVMLSTDLQNLRNVESYCERTSKDLYLGRMSWLKGVVRSR